MQQLVQLRGRGAPQNPRNRFVDAEYVADGDWLDSLGDDEPDPRTEFLRDHTRGIISRNDSPDIPFDTSVNPYRGCEHGCICLLPKASHEHAKVAALLEVSELEMPLG